MQQIVASHRRHCLPPVPTRRAQDARDHDSEGTKHATDDRSYEGTTTVRLGGVHRCAGSSGASPQGS